METHAQADAWVLTNPAGTAGSWVNTAPDVPVIGPAVALPTPGGPDGYAGQVPTRSHHIRTNGDGSIIFFAVDGNLYNGDGYRIADQRAPNCTVCLAPGAMEFLSVPVPGTCGSYFLFSGVPSSIPVPNAHNAFVQFSVLDMDLPTDPDAPASECTPQMGRILTITEMEQRLPQLQDWLASEFRAWYEPSTSLLPTSDRVLELWMVNFGAKGLAPQIRIVAGEGPDDDSFLFFKTASTLHVYRISANGVIPVQQSLPGTVGDNTYLIPLDDDYDNPGTQTYYFHDSDARRLSNGTIRYAATSNFRFTPFPASTPNGNLISMLFNGTTGVMLPGSNDVFGLEAPLGGVTCPSTAAGSPGGIAGCAIAADGQRIFLSMETTPDCVTWTPKFGYLDLGPELFTDLNVSLGIPTPYMHGRIYRNRGLSTNGESIYLTGSSTSVGVVNDFNGATPSFSVVNSLSAVAPLFAQPVVNGSNLFQRFLNTSVSGDQHLSTASKAQCCSYFETVPGATVEGYTQAAGTTITWNGTQNTVQPGTSTVVFTCDVVVEPGARLVVNNMNWKFAADARVIVQEGGYLQMNNATLDAVNCPGDRWPGIAVLGDPGQSQQGQAPWGVPAQQGMVQLTNCTLSNAYIGILSGNGTVGFNGYLYNISNSEGGAVVLANGCTFRNCITAVDMRKYPDFVPQGQPLPLNRSRFNGSTFMVDEVLTVEPFNFKRHVRLDRVSGVIFRKCHFQNLVNDAEYATLGSAALGYGIESYESQFQVLPSCSILLNAGEECPTGNTVPSTFTGLDHGIHAIGGPNALRNFTVDAARFTDNICGVYTSGVVGFVAKRSNFEIGGRGVPQTNPLETPFWADFHRGVYSYNGYGFTVQDNTLSRSVNAGNDIRTEGVVIGYSRDHNDVVFRNIGTNLLRGFVGEGVCASLAPSYTPVIGLQLKCNVNQNNEWNLVSRKANDQDDDLQDLHTIRANQGETDLPMDNQFDGWDGTNDKWDFRVTTTLNPISYFHRNSGVDPFVPQVSSDPVIAAQNFLMNPQPVVITPTNTCNKRIQRLPGLSDGLTPGEIKAFMETEKIAYGTTRYLYDQLIDGGSMDEVVQEITDAWPQDAWDLRAYLMSKSPYLSTTVLKDLNAQNKLPQAMYVEVCAANPDATKADGFTAWLKSDAPHPLQEYMVAAIEDSWNVRTYRTNLELTMADRHASMSQAGNVLIEVYSGDTVYDPQDSLRMLWQEVRTPAARYAEAIGWMQRGEFDFARNLVAAIPQEHTKLREKEIYEKDRMVALIDLLKAFKQTDRPLDALTPAEQDQLEAISQGSSDRAATWAQNLLCFHYERCAAPYTGEAGDGGSKSRAIVNDVEPNDVALITMSPNPTANWSAVTIVLPNAADQATLVVMNLSGKVVQRHRLAHATQQVVLDTRGLAPGAYLVELRSDSASLAQEKLIVQP
jgi:hypothetical protein